MQALDRQREQARSKSDLAHQNKSKDTAMKDNQNRDLKSAKLHSALIAEMHRQGSIEAAEAFEGKRLAEWTEVEGIQVLRVEGSKFVGVPITGRKNSRKFDIINLDDRSNIVCQLNSNEVRGWLFRVGN